MDVWCDAKRRRQEIKGRTVKEFRYSICVSCLCVSGVEARNVEIVWTSGLWSVNKIGISVKHAGIEYLRV